MPSGPQLTQNYYEILGLERTASADEIKKRFRELARTSHPDVNTGDPNASKKFADVTTAYKTLSDPLARSTYDAELALMERRAETARARASGATSSASFSTHQARPGATPTTPPPAGGSSPAPGDEATRLAGQARDALSRMRYVEARDLAQRSLRIKRTAEGYEVLGLVYEVQGRNDDAINMFTMSLQLNNRNSRLMERLVRLSRSGSSPRRPDRRYDMKNESPYPMPDNRGAYGGGFDDPTQPAPMRGGNSYGASADADHKRPLFVMLVAVFGYGMSFLMLLYLMMFGHDAPIGRGPIPLALVSRWSDTLVTVLIITGITLGTTMSLTGAIRRLEYELPFNRSTSGFVPPIGPIFIVLSIVSFWAAALLHLLFSALQEARLAGMMRAFIAVTVVVVLAGLFYDPEGRLQVFLFGGNVVFLSYLFGWFIGDLFRMD